LASGAIAGLGQAAADDVADADQCGQQRGAEQVQAGVVLDQVDDDEGGDAAGREPGLGRDELPASSRTLRVGIAVLRFSTYSVCRSRST
jgi:hypothetical protein